jgi:hypothetical protein
MRAVHARDAFLLLSKRGHGMIPFGNQQNHPE